MFTRETKKSKLGAKADQFKCNKTTTIENQIRTEA